ncbi:MAG: hypothetical protein ACOZAO_00870 [Patescibacteria group bacterium]
MDKNKVVYAIFVLLILLSIPLALTIITANELANCYEQSSQILTIETERMLTETDGIPQKGDICSTGYTITKDLMSCVNKVDKKSLIPLPIIYKATNLIQKSEVNPIYAAQKHNEFCGEYSEYFINL